MASLRINNSIESIIMLRRGGKVRRYHTADVLYVENNAEHSFGVALLILALWPDASAALLRAALVHDLQELYVGDMPHTVKRDNAKLTEEYFFAELVACERMGTLEIMQELNDADRERLRAADVADAWLYAHDEYHRGNVATAYTIMSNCMRAFDAMPVLPQWFRERVNHIYHVLLEGK